LPPPMNQILTHIVDKELEEALKSFRQPATITA